MNGTTHTMSKKAFLGWLVRVGLGWSGLVRVGPTMYKKHSSGGWSGLVRVGLGWSELVLVGLGWSRLV